MPSPETSSVEPVQLADLFLARQCSAKLFAAALHISERTLYALLCGDSPVSALTAFAICHSLGRPSGSVLFTKTLPRARHRKRHRKRRLSAPGS